MSEDILKQWSVSKRPPTLDDFLGSQQLISQVEKVIETRKYHAILITGPTGCLPADSEFLTTTGWKRMDQYTPKDLVAVFDKDTEEVEFQPVEYVRLKCEEPFHVFDSGSLVMELSGEHRVLYDDYRGVRKVATADECAAKPSKRTIPTTFRLSAEDADLSDLEIRLRVAFSADGGFCPGQSNQMRFTFRKNRKKHRLAKLLNKASIPYSVTQSSTRDTETTFTIPLQPDWTRELAWVWSLSERQLSIVARECTLWDGSTKAGELLYYSTIKSNADAVQYAAHASGFRATIKIRKYQDNPTWKDSYDVHIRTSDNAKNKASIRVDTTTIGKRRSPDGYKYCFTTSTGFFIARCRDTVFATGNCGKTTLAKIIAYAIAKLPYGEKHGDIIEENIGADGGKEDVRKLIEASRFMPHSKDGRKVFILDECHKLSGAAMDAFLKPLEEPAPHVVWILCTNEPEKLKPVMVGRCYPLKVDLADPLELANMLLQVLKEEKELRNWTSEDRKALVKAVVVAAGQIPRMALQLLAAAVDSEADYKNVQDLIAGAIMSAPGVALDQAANKILIGLLMRYELGAKTAKAVFNAATEHDAYALMRRVTSLSNMLFMESITEKPVPGTYMFNKDAAQVLPGKGITKVSSKAMGEIHGRMVSALLSNKDFSVDPKLLLTDALYDLYNTLPPPKTSAKEIGL